MLEDQFSKTSDSFSQYKERVSKLSSEFEFGLFFFLVRKSILWVLFFFLVAFSVAYLYLRYTPQVFESKTVLQINNENEATKILNMQNMAGENPDDIAKSIELLRSTVFFKRALQTLPLRVTYFAEGTFRSNEHYKVNAYMADVPVIRSETIYGVPAYVYFNNEAGGTIHYNIGGKTKEYNFKTGELLSTPEMDVTITLNNYSEISNQEGAVKENKLYFIVNDFNALTNDYYPRLNVRLQNDAAKTVEIS